MTRGKVHGYLAMKLDYTKLGKVSIDVKSYIQETFNEYLEYDEAY